MPKQIEGEKRLVHLDKVVSDGLKHRGGFLIKALGRRGGLSNRHLAMQTLYKRKSPAVPRVGMINHYTE